MITRPGRSRWLSAVAAIALVLGGSLLVAAPARASVVPVPESPAASTAATDPDGSGGASPQREPAGQYEYTCTGVDGNAYSYTEANLPGCVGYVDVYINGEQIAHYSQTGQTASLSCTLGVGTSIVQIFSGTIYTGWGFASWVWSSYLTGLGCNGS